MKIIPCFSLKVKYFLLDFPVFLHFLHLKKVESRKNAVSLPLKALLWGQNDTKSIG